MPKSKDDAFEVSDPTDWLETPLPSLAPLDSALRCQVCRDFFTTPMITSCSHTFCSLCIRHCLGNDGKCPTCRKEDQASKLKNNYAIEDLVEAFQRARPHVLEHAKKISEEVVSGLSSKRKRTETEIEDGSSPARRRTRSGRRAHESSQQIVVDDSEAGDEDYVPVEEAKKPGQVLCPICQDGFPTVKAVQAHVDHCDGEPPSKKHRLRSSQTLLPPQPVSKPTKRPERIGQLHYSTVKDNVLRKKLTDLGLSTSGTRQLMERRHIEWVTLWNANCDSKNPKSKGELKKELDIWERTHGGGALVSSRANPGGNIRDKDFDGSAWARKHDDSFKQLIAEARRKKAVKADGAEATPKPEAASSSVTPPTTTYSTTHTSPYVPAASTIPAQHSHKSSKNDVPERISKSSRDHSSSNPILPTIGGSVNTNEDPSNQSYLQDESQSEIIPASPLGISSERRFFEDNTEPFQPTPSSQY